MFIQSLELSDYRNYEHLNIDFSENINILYGDNAQGKTNLLEAIYLCATTKSYRGSRDKEIIRFDSNESHIKMMLDRQGSLYRIDMHLKKYKNKGIAVNSIPIRRASELFGIVNVIFFSPEDLQIIKNGPSERRKFMDSELCQLDKIYLNHYGNYVKTVSQRNVLLKQICEGKSVYDSSMIDVYDSQLVNYGSKMIEIRGKFIARLNEIIQDIHKNLTGGREEIKVLYEPNVGIERFEEELFIGRERDIRTCTTNTGPHRDDISFTVYSEGRKKIDIRTFGSQGQTRTAALSLKMAEIELVKNHTGQSPVLLLDDVLSELDSKRQMQLLQSIQGIQTFITCTGLDEFVKNRFQMDRVFYVENGKIIQQ